MSHSGNIYCSMCTYSFNTEDQLERHEENDHSEWEKNNDSIGSNTTSFFVSEATQEQNPISVM